MANFVTWITTEDPPKPGFYLITIIRENGIPFCGYGFWDGEDWLTASKKFVLDFEITAWAYKPIPHNG